MEAAAKWRKTNRTSWWLVPSEVGSLRSFPHFQEKANDLWNRERVPLDPFSNFSWVGSCAFLG